MAESNVALSTFEGGCEKTLPRRVDPYAAYRTGAATAAVGVNAGHRVLNGERHERSSLPALNHALTAVGLNKSDGSHDPPAWTYCKQVSKNSSCRNCGICALLAFAAGPATRQRLSAKTSLAGNIPSDPFPFLTGRFDPSRPPSAWAMRPATAWRPSPQSRRSPLAVSPAASSVHLL